MDHSLNGEGENIHDVDSFNDAINELNQEELAATNASDFEMEQGNSLTFEEYQDLVDQLNDAEKELRDASSEQPKLEDEKEISNIVDEEEEAEEEDEEEEAEEAFESSNYKEILDGSSQDVDSSVKSESTLGANSQENAPNQPYQEEESLQADFEEFFKEIKDESKKNDEIEIELEDSDSQREYPPGYNYSQVQAPHFQNTHHMPQSGGVKPGTPIDIRGTANSSLHAGQKAGNGLFEGLSFIAKGATALAGASGAAVYGAMETVGKKAAEKSGSAISGASEWMTEWSKTKGESNEAGSAESSVVELDGDANLVKGVFEDLAKEVKYAVEIGNFEQASEMISEISSYLKETGSVVGDGEFLEPLISDLNETVGGAKELDEEEKENLLQAIKEVLEAIKSLFSKAAETPSMS